MSIAQPTDFDLDFRIGKIAEKKLERLLRGTKIEVKYDRLAKRTGNIFFEYYYKGRESKSSLFTTTAEWFAIILADNGTILIFRTEQLRERIINLCSLGKAIKTYGGDNDDSLGYLIRIEDLFRR